VSPKICYDHNKLENQILINGIPIKQVRSAQFLGVSLDEHLTWSDYMVTIIGKSSKT